MTDTANVTHLGNPVPQIPAIAGGAVQGGVEADTGASITTMHWAPDIVDALTSGLPELQKAIKDEGREYFALRVQGGILQGQQMRDWELAAGHVLVAVSAHARAGVSWAASEDSRLEKALAAIFGATVAPKGTSAALKLAQIEGDPEKWAEAEEKIEGLTALKTKKGVEVIANASFGTAAQPAAMNYVALTANNEAAANTDLSLAGEITTASGGLIRKQATYGFTESTGVATLTITFTANTNDSLPVTVNKFGVFNATSGGTMGIETKLSSAVTFAASGDNMTLTETLTIT